MQVLNDNNLILLVRATPGSAPAVDALNRASRMLRESSGELVVFFHGAGVEHACAPNAAEWSPLAARGARLEVCRAAWQRRHDDEPDSAFISSSLVSFWHRVASDHQLACCGQGQHASGELPGRGWVIEVTAPPSDPDSREILELVLAGASLELPLAVIFRDHGCSHLTGAEARGWRQLVDFELAELYHCCSEGGESDIAATPLSRDRAERLCETARGVIST